MCLAHSYPTWLEHRCTCHCLPTRPLLTPLLTLSESRAFTNTSRHTSHHTSHRTVRTYPLTFPFPNRFLTHPNTRGGRRRGEAQRKRRRGRQREGVEGEKEERGGGEGDEMTAAAGKWEWCEFRASSNIRLNTRICHSFHTSLITNHPPHPQLLRTDLLPYRQGRGGRVKKKIDWFSSKRRSIKCDPRTCR